MLGTEGKFGESLGLTNDWVVRIIKAVGNYGESFERHFGAKTSTAAARRQQPLDEGRSAIRPADPLRRDGI